MYDNMYTEDADFSDSIAQSVEPGTIASTGPATGDISSNNHPATTALLSLQTELQKAGLGSDPRVIQHIQGLSSIIKPAAVK